MTTWKTVRVVAGLLIVASIALGSPDSPFFLSPWWLALAVFVGLNLFQSGLTDWCLMERALRKLGIASESSAAKA